MDTSVRGLRDHPYPDRTVGRLVAKMGQGLGDAPYIADNHTGPVSFGGVAQRVSRAAAGLTELGVQRDENVGVLMPNRVEFFVAAWAQPWRGGVTVPLHSALKGVMLRDAIVKCRVSTVITVPERVAELTGISRETGYPRGMVIFGPLEEAWPASIHSWDALTTPGEMPPADTDPAEPAILMLTSGSTGGPK